jgi:threonine/homoserine/homoserine lactone efflux protein
VPVAINASPAGSYDRTTVNLSDVAAFALAAAIIIAIPGPSVLFVISRGVVLGRRAALATVIGNCAGVYVQVAAVALGLGVIVERSAVAYNTVRFAGALYLVWLGVRTFQKRRSLAAALRGPVEEKSGRRILREGFVVGITNPKAAVFFAAILPQFTDPSLGHVALQMLVLGLVFICIALVLDGIWAVAAGTARDRLVSSSRALETIGGAGGIVIVVLGLTLAVTGRRP